MRWLLALKARWPLVTRARLEQALDDLANASLEADHAADVIAADLRLDLDDQQLLLDVTERLLAARAETDRLRAQLRREERRADRLFADSLRMNEQVRHQEQALVTIASYHEDTGRVGASCTEGCGGRWPCVTYADAAAVLKAYGQVPA